MRLAILTNDRLSPAVNWTTLSLPLNAAIEAAGEGSVIAPPPLRHMGNREGRQSLKSAWGADTFFWMQGSARPEWSFLATAGVRPFGRRSAYVIDPWRATFPKIRLVTRVLNLQPCLVAFKEAADELSATLPDGRVRWMPFGIDANVFAPRAKNRDIFAFWMGRRYNPLHQALLQYCQSRDLKYVYHHQGDRHLTTTELGDLASRSRYFVVTPPDLDNPGRTGGLSPLVMRYYEGLAAGCRLLGILPRSGEYEMLLPLEGILQVESDGSDLENRLQGDEATLTAQNSDETYSIAVRTHHSWSTRAMQVVETLDGARPDFFKVE